MLVKNEGVCENESKKREGMETVLEKNQKCTNNGFGLDWKEATKMTKA